LTNIKLSRREYVKINTLQTCEQGHKLTQTWFNQFHYTQNVPANTFCTLSETLKGEEAKTH